MRCGRERSNEVCFSFAVASVIAVFGVIIFGTIGIPKLMHSNRCKCLAEVQWYNKCPDGIAFGYNFYITCPTIETFYNPDYVTPCREPEEMERYRWKVGVEETCWLQLDARLSFVHVNTSVSSVNITSNGTKSTPPISSTPPIPGEIREITTYRAYGITHNSEGVGFTIVASISFVVIIIAFPCMFVWCE